MTMMNEERRCRENQTNLYFLYRWAGSNVMLGEDTTSGQMLNFADKKYFNWGPNLGEYCLTNLPLLHHGLRPHSQYLDR